MKTNPHLAEAVISSTEPDTVLPSQYFGPQQKQRPEQRLMIAVLHEALHCIKKYRLATGSRGRRLFREAQRWFLANEAHWPYSFEAICAVLDLDANAVRRRLRLGPRRRPVHVLRKLHVATRERETLASMTSATSVGSA